MQERFFIFREVYLNRELWLDLWFYAFELDKGGIVGFNSQGPGFPGWCYSLNSVISVAYIVDTGVNAFRGGSENSCSGVHVQTINLGIYVSAGKYYSTSPALRIDI